MESLHPNTQAIIQAVASHPAGAYGFVGPAGSNRTTAALWLTAKLNCTAGGCGQCQNCRLIQSGNFPDLVTIQPDGQSIGITQIQELKSALELKPYYAEGWRVVIIAAADSLTIQAQNALLKILEEPPSRTIFVVIAEQYNALLPTVRSRLKPIFFAGQTPQTAAEFPVLSSDLFSRLLMAQSLTDQSDGWLSSLSAQLRQQLRSETDLDEVGQAARKLAAVARTKQYLQANVNARAALEGLMLEL